MAQFNVKWPSGKELTVEKSDCATVDEFINSYFGRNADPEEQGTKVTLVGEEEPASAPAPAVVPASKTVVKAKK